MIIGIDIRVLARNIRTGIEEYTLNLLSYLLPLDKSIGYRLFYNAFYKADLDYPWTDLPNIQIKEFRIPNRILDISSRFFKAPKIDKLMRGVDLFFTPHFLISGLSQNCKRVVTFHDLSFEHHPQFFPWQKRYWHFSMNPRAQAREADKIIAVSQSTKEDLVNLYGIEPQKIKVVYSGVGEQYRPSLLSLRGDEIPHFVRDRLRNLENKPKEIASSVPPHLCVNEGVLPRNDKKEEIRRKYNLPERFILYLGTIEPRKNITGLIRAFEVLKESCKDESLGNKKLVIAGTKGWLYEDIFRQARESKYASDIVFTGFIEDQDKPCLYNLADLFVYPSFFEGFGFPPLEAMACGVPVITSSVSSLPEVVEDAAIMIDPCNIDELAWAMEMVLSDRDLGIQLARKGIKQARKFSWGKCAKETLEVLLE